jgi:hypothetical protein
MVAVFNAFKELSEPDTLAQQAIDDADLKLPPGFGLEQLQEKLLIIALMVPVHARHAFKEPEAVAKETGSLLGAITALQQVLNPQSRELGVWPATYAKTPTQRARDLIRTGLVRHFLTSGGHDYLRQVSEQLGDLAAVIEGVRNEHVLSPDMKAAQASYKADLHRVNERDRTSSSPSEQLLDMLVADLEELWRRMYGERPGIVDAAEEGKRKAGSGARFQRLVAFMCGQVGIEGNPVKGKARPISGNAVMESVKRVVRPLKELDAERELERAALAVQVRHNPLLHTATALGRVI